jgi:hypothetical protein
MQYRSSSWSCGSRTTRRLGAGARFGDRLGIVMAILLALRLGVDRRGDARAMTDRRRVRLPEGRQSFGLQTQLDRRGRYLARCCRVVLEDLKRFAECCCRDLSLTQHNARAHEAGPTLNIARITLYATR